MDINEGVERELENGKEMEISPGLYSNIQIIQTFKLFKHKLLLLQKMQQKV